MRAEAPPSLNSGISIEVSRGRFPPTPHMFFQMLLRLEVKCLSWYGSRATTPIISTAKAWSSSVERADSQFTTPPRSPAKESRPFNELKLRWSN